MILVTGASGLLGANLVLTAANAGRPVAAATYEIPARFPGTESYRADLRDPAAFRALAEKVRPEWIVHCAAATDVDWCEAHPEEAERINADGSGGVARAAAAVGARLVYVSTDAVFDGARGGYDEGDAPAPCNVYGRTKRKGERLVQEALPSALVVRTNLYGWNLQAKRSLGEWALNRLQAGQVVPGFEDVTFTPLSAHDLAAILLDLIDGSAEGLLHVAGSEAVSKYEFARRVAKVFGYDERFVRAVSVATSELKAPRPRNTSLSTEKAAGLLGHPLPDVDAGLKRFREDRDRGWADELRACRKG